MDCRPQTAGEWDAFDRGFDAASKAFRDGARACARQSAYALAELAAERARMRRWRLRLRWRAAQSRDNTSCVREAWEFDRLLHRAAITRGRGERYLPIAGPRGVLP